MLNDPTSNGGGSKNLRLVGAPVARDILSGTVPANNLNLQTALRELRNTQATSSRHSDPHHSARQVAITAMDEALNRHCAVNVRGAETALRNFANSF